MVPQNDKVRGGVYRRDKTEMYKIKSSRPTPGDRMNVCSDEFLKSTFE